MHLSKYLGAIVSGLFMAGLGIYFRFFVSLPKGNGRMGNRLEDDLATLTMVFFGFGGILIVLGVVGVFAWIGAQREPF